MTAFSDPDRAVAEVAAANYGVVDRAQLRACGLDRQAIAWRTARHRLVALYPGVYAVGTPSCGWRASGWPRSGIAAPARP